MSNIQKFSSKKEVTEFLATKGIDTSNWSEEKWLLLNKGQAEIHMMALAEAIYDAVNESEPKQLQAGEWHIPFEDKLDEDKIEDLLRGPHRASYIRKDGDVTQAKVEISTAMAARTSYTVVGDEKEINYENLIFLHDRLINQNPLHASPMEHCARAMSDREYTSFIRGQVPDFEDDWGYGTHENYIFQKKDGNINKIDKDSVKNHGWCRNFKGFIQYRHILEQQ